MRTKILVGVLLSLVILADCSSNTSSGGDGGDRDGYQADGFSDADGGGDEILPDGGDQVDASGNDGAADPCAQLSCPKWQHCEVVGQEAVCRDNTCADLQCAPTEECQPHPGGGAWCVDISCREDLDCPPERFCDNGLCRDDVCAGGCRRCADKTVQICLPSGSGWQNLMVCASDAYFESICMEKAPCEAFCTCQDDWDCPAWTECDAGFCVGSGKEPSCRLDPQPFANVLPVPEIIWGGTQASPIASGSPFPESTQVVMVPLVVNLDDDSGDGLIDERDFPEIVFFTFGVRGSTHDFTQNGILRAIHGGGPNKGKDYFAVCGDKVWKEGDPLDLPCNYVEADIDSTSTPAAGDLDGDGKPEIVAVSELDANNNRGIFIYASDGEIISKNRATGNLGGVNPAVTLANMDGQGFAEIIIGRNVFTLEKDAKGKLQVLDRFQGTLANGTNGQGPVSCVADINGDGRPEVIAGTAAYRLPRPPAGVSRRSECTGNEVDPEEVAFCNGQLMVVWDAATLNSLPSTKREGFCAVADVLGANAVDPPGPQNPLDGKPEVILIANGWLLVLEGRTGMLLRNINLADGTRGGAPNVDDFDGDGFPEVGTAFLDRYIMYDFQPPTEHCPAWPAVMVEGQPRPAENLPRDPGGLCDDDSDCRAGEAVCNKKTGSCVCLHNAWASRTEDDSSRVTGSSVFDFNGDGAAEVVYNDECRFRVYDGLDGDILFSEPSESRTRIEYPVIADVDNDGNAEIVFCTSTESGFCSENLDDQYNAGVEVWGDAGDFWVPARRIWNQHAYHVTNVLESGAIPAREAENWRTYQGRRYNTYRSNPRSYDWAPDLVLGGLHFSSPDAACGVLSQLLDISLKLENRGDVRVGPSLQVGFWGTWEDLQITEELKDPSGQPLRLVLQLPLEPGAIQFLKVTYRAQDNGHGRLPDVIRAKVDVENRERECLEDNNEMQARVEAGVQAPDLRLELGAIGRESCPYPTVLTRIVNEGSRPASGVVVRYYAGDPRQGGEPIGEIAWGQPIQPGETVTVEAQLGDVPRRLITIYALVDPENKVEECDEADNLAAGGQVYCPET